MQVTTHHHDRQPSSPLIVSATRYVPDNAPVAGFTLIVAHATGTHKETWGPLFEYLFELQAEDGSTACIVEAWSIECPNHGQSAVMNGPEIDTHFGTSWNGWEYPRAMKAFIDSRPVGVDFYKRTLVALGHSSGGNSLTLLHHLQPNLDFKAFILLDPTLGKQSPERDQMQRVLSQIVWNKKDTWPSRAAALKELSVTPGYRNWHPDTLKLFVEKALHAHPASQYPDPWKFLGVTLSCSRVYEAACYRDNNHHDLAFDVLHSLYRSAIPVDLILSKQDEFGGTELKRRLTIPEPSSNKGPRSVQYIEKGGHMFVQTYPKPAAVAIWQALMLNLINNNNAAKVLSEHPFMLAKL